MGEAMLGQGREPIAVVGMACRFPGTYPGSTFLPIREYVKKSS
jgi:hypothetical protein